jgi:hypothetical protein
MGWVTLIDLLRQCSRGIFLAVSMANISILAVRKRKRTVSTPSKGENLTRRSPLK